MAGCDYYNCDNCGKGKVFYDANVDWEEFKERIGQVRVTCKECFDNGFRLEICRRTVGHNYGIGQRED